MKYYLRTLAGAAAILAAATPVFAGGQVAGRPGVTLTEAAQEKFNRDDRHNARPVAVIPGMSSSNARAQLAASAGLGAEAESLTLAQIFVAKINHEGRGDDQQALPGGTVTMASRSYGVTPGRVQLIAGRGLTADEAVGLSLTELAIAKFNREARGDDRQGVAN